MAHYCYCRICGRYRPNEKMITEMGCHRHDSEVHLLHAQLALASDKKDTAQESLIKAKALIDKMGMHRWDFEMKEMEKQLGKKV